MSESLLVSFEVPDGDSEIQTLSILSQAIIRFLRSEGPHEDSRDAETVDRMIRWLASRHMSKKPQEPTDG